MTSSKGPIALPHQLEGIQFIREREAAALFDEQGLGKTKQLIDALSQEIAAGVIAAALVICPNGLKTTWAEEIEKHSSMRYAVFGAGRRARREAFGSLRAQIYVINYEAVAAELPSLKALLRFRPTALVLDESHRIKTPGARVTRAIFALRSESPKRVIATGTPVANKPEDLWAQLFFLDGGEAVGQTFAAFRSRYTAKGGYTNIDELRERVAGLSLRREKSSTLTLPEKTVVRVPVRIDGEQLRMYEVLRNELAVWVRTLTGEQVLEQAENILTRLVRLAQLASNPSLLDAGYAETPAKFQALDTLLHSYIGEQHSKVIVWTSFVGNIGALLSRYSTYRPVSIYGEMPNKERDRAIRAFKEDPRVQLLVANPAAAREGLTLTQSRVAIYLDRTFNLVDFLQSQDRIHRLSQSRPCDIVLLIAERTVDEFVDFSLAQKHRLARYTQRDTGEISPRDLELRKPDVLRALVNPEG
jgi:SWI/SNF-related matrix-associated actin-dependent regulator 1 of chromatin subfamily A